MLRYELNRIEGTILALFAERKTCRLLTKEIFQELPDYSHADLVRGFEDLEKSHRLLVRYTKEGSDWITLTSDGAERIGIPNNVDNLSPGVIPHPPRSSTSKNVS